MTFNWTCLHRGMSENTYVQSKNPNNPNTSYHKQTDKETTKKNCNQKVLNYKSLHLIPGSGIIKHTWTMGEGGQKYKPTY